MVGGISFSGIASGLDTGAIIQALLAVERIPIDLLEDRRQDRQVQVSLVNSFRGLVQTLRDRADALATPGEVLSYAADVSDPSFAKISAGSGAAAGSHTLEVFFLATADRYVFDAVTDPDADLGTADGQGVSFDYDGQSYDVTVDAADSSLNEIAAAINAQAGQAVQATVVNTGTASNPSYELVLTGRDTGEDFSIDNLSSSLTGLTVDGTPGGASNLTQAGNAVAEIDGLLVERSTNDFSDVLEGISIELLSADQGAQTITFSVSPDRDAIVRGLQDFVDAYNAVNSFVRDQSEVDEDGNASGALFGDNLLATVQRTLRTTLFGQSAAAVAADTSGFGTLRLVGIELQSDGSLSIDRSVLDAKLDEDVDAVADLFADSDGFDNGGAQPGDANYYVDSTADTGLADDLARALDRLLTSSVGAGNTSFKGIFDTRLEALNGNISDINDQIADRERRLETVEAQLVARFTALETLLGQLNAQQASLNSVLLATQR